MNKLLIETYNYSKNGPCYSFKQYYLKLLNPFIWKYVSKKWLKWNYNYQLYLLFTYLSIKYKNKINERIT